MDDDKRAALEERRRSMQQRNAARAFRAGIEPAWSPLERAGEDFRVYRIGEEPSWCPAWVPKGYSRMPWDQLDHVERSASQLEREHLVRIVNDLLADRLEPEEELLFVAEGKAWSIGMACEVFSRHAETLLDAAWDSAYIAAPPAHWLIYVGCHEVVWKDD